MRSSGHRYNGGYHEERPTDLCADAEFSIRKGPSAVDREKHSCLAALLGQTAWSCADGNATVRERSASARAGARRVIFPEPFSIAGGKCWCLSLLDWVPGLEIRIQQHTEHARRIHHRGRTKWMLGEPKEDPWNQIIVQDAPLPGKYQTVVGTRIG